MGGLGANIGSDDWEKAQRKKESALIYAEQVRATVRPQLPKQPKAPQPRELTAREKAIEFAKQVPKPRAKPQDPEPKPEPEERMSKRQEMEALDQKNKMYANELEKIK